MANIQRIFIIEAIIGRQINQIQIITASNKLVTFFKHRITLAFYVTFGSFKCSMTNVEPNLTIQVNRKQQIIDLVLGIRTLNCRIAGTDGYTRLRMPTYLGPELFSNKILFKPSQTFYPVKNEEGSQTFQRQK